LEIRSSVAEARPVPFSPAEVLRIREALADILQSAPFRGSRQSQLLLTYVIDHTLSGENELLRERVIGTQVFGRSCDYEPGEDPIVRVRAADLRKRLAQYYQDRADSAVRIEIPAGSYRAVFRFRPDRIPTPAIETDRHPPASLWRWVVFAVLAAATIGIVIRSLYPATPTALDQFWAPALASPKPILIYNATTTVFHSSQFAGESRDLLPIRGQYTCIGDAYAAAVLASLFARKGKLYQLRYGADLTFGDLRYQPSILIGAFNNAWTLQMTNELRFVFENHPTIRDRSDHRVYTPPDLQQDGRTTDDYAIVSRIFDSKSGELLITAAGITQYGTRAAGEFLTSLPLMKSLARKAPRDWPKKNIQILLHTRIIDEIPGPPDIVKSYFW